ncbi:MAG: acyl-CoA carboxylase subunit beta [Pseudomonadota bacterium]
MTMQEKIQGIEGLRSELLRGGGPDAIERQHEKGRLTARERIEKLLDPGTFYELELFSKPIETGLEIDKRTVKGDGLVSGYGEVNGRPVCVWAQDATVLRGRAGIIHGAKIVTLIERALKVKVPCVGMIDSEGVRVEDMITTPTNYSYDRLAYIQTMASGIIPQISVIMGPCTGAAAISAQLSDFVFMVSGTSSSHVSHPSVGVDSERMGGAAMHFKQSGCCDVMADGDEDCIEKVKKLLSFLPLNNKDRAPELDTGDDSNRQVPELFDIVPAESKKPYDVHDVIHAIADKGVFFETRGGWARNLVTGFARFGGRSAGIIANNPRIMGGCLDVDSADKLARFVRFCDAFNIPILYLADTPAFLPAIEQERKGIIRHGAKAVFSNSVATTPQMQIYLRKCYGGGSLAMPGNNLGGDFGLAWPTSEILLMHPEGAVAIIHRKEIAAAENPAEEFNRRLVEFKDAGAVENLWEAMTIQDFINPKDTRAKIIKTLKILSRKEAVGSRKRHDNMPL